MPAPKKYDDNAAKQCAYRERLAQARNDERRAKGLPSAPAIPSIPAARRWQAQMQQARGLLQAAHQEMSDYYTDRSDAWQESGNGDDFQARMESVDELVNLLNDLLH